MSVKVGTTEEAFVMKRVLKCFAKLREFTPEIIVSAVDRYRLERLIIETPGDIAFMNAILEAAIKQDRLRSSQEVYRRVSEAPL